MRRRFPSWLEDKDFDAPISRNGENPEPVPPCGVPSDGGPPRGAERASGRAPLAARTNPLKCPTGALPSPLKLDRKTILSNSGPSLGQAI